MPIIKKYWVNKLRPCSTNFEEVSIWSPWNLISIPTLYYLQSKVEWWQSWYGRHVNITVSQLNADVTVARVVLLLKLMVCNKRVSLIRIIAYRSSWYCLSTLKKPHRRMRNIPKSSQTINFPRSPCTIIISAQRFWSDTSITTPWV